MSSKREKADPDKSDEGNCLIDNLPAAQRKSVLSKCRLVELNAGTILCESGHPLNYAYFPVSGTISLVTRIPGQRPLEIESIGREGMLGISLILNIKYAPQRGVTQTSCLALRIKPGGLRAGFRNHPALAQTLQHHMYGVILELSRTAACISFHEAGQRLALKLLLAHDRAGGDYLYLTHQTLADLLGVQRGAVSIVANKWQREGLIRYSRGKIEILNRRGLEAESCGCYQAGKQEYANIL